MKVACNFLGFFLFVFMLISCYTAKKSLNSKDLTFLNKEVDSMYLLDQKNRQLSHTIDSLYGVDWKSNGKFLSTKEKKKLLGEKYNRYVHKLDSLLEIRTKIDYSNSENLIFLTKKYGFPSQNRLKAKKAKAYFIFVHSPKLFHPTVRELILKEYKESRISEYEKGYIFWHLNGREGFPPRLGKNGKVIY